MAKASAGVIVFILCCSKCSLFVLVQAAVTKYHRPFGLGTTEISHSSEAGKSKLKAVTHSVSGGNPFPDSQPPSVSSHSKRGREFSKASPIRGDYSHS